MTTIKDLVAVSREYHGKFSPSDRIVRNYSSGDFFYNYKCAIGCNLHNPAKLQEISGKLNLYRIDSLRNQYLEEDIDPTGNYVEWREKLRTFVYQEPILKNIFEDDKLMVLAKSLQAIHDKCTTVGEYLKYLNTWESSGFEPAQVSCLTQLDL